MVAVERVDHSDVDVFDGDAEDHNSHIPADGHSQRVPVDRHGHISVLGCGIHVSAWSTEETFALQI